MQLLNIKNDNYSGKNSSRKIIASHGKNSFFVTVVEQSSEKQYLLVQNQNNSVHNISALADSVMHFI